MLFESKKKLEKNNERQIKYALMENLPEFTIRLEL